MRCRLGLIVTFFASTALAQGSATLRGRVLDSTGATLPGVTVEAAAAGKTVVAVTSVDGSYGLPLPAGTYDISFHLINFATTIKRGVTVSGEVRGDVTLRLAPRARGGATGQPTFRELSVLG